MTATAFFQLFSYDMQFGDGKTEGQIAESQ